MGGGGRGMGVLPEEKWLLSFFPILPGALALKPVPQSLRHFPLRVGLVFSYVWCCWGGGGHHWLAVFSCLYERKLAVSQQTKELSVTRGRPLPQQKVRGV